VDTFRWSNLKANRDLFLVLISLTFFMFAFNIFFPFIMIYLNHYIKLEMLQSSLLIAICILIGGVGTAFPMGYLSDRWGRKPVAIISVVMESVGLLLFSLTKSYIPLILTGIIWLGGYTAWTVASGAWTKDLYPEDKRGQFAGFYILFNIAFTMIPGPLLGGWLASRYGIPTVLDGKAGTIPTPLVFQVAAVAVLLTLIPLLLIGKGKQIQK
jgi:MFS family permease